MGSAIKMFLDQFQCLFLRHHFLGKPVVLSWNVCCFFRLTHIIFYVFFCPIFDVACLEMVLNRQTSLSPRRLAVKSIAVYQN